VLLKETPVLSRLIIRSEAIVVLAMVIVAFALIENNLIEDSISNHQQYKVCCPISCKVMIARFDTLYRQYHVTSPYLAWQSALNFAIFFPDRSSLLIGCRIFEAIMAFDALRLRNVIQLVGILGVLKVSPTSTDLRI
jgi:hypothetical protein